MYRQGDVLITPIRGQIPEGATRRGDGILAQGEATGHSHRVDPGRAALFEKEGTMFLQVLEPTEVTHEEHGPIRLAPGTYKITHQREYDGSDWRWIGD